MSATLLHHLLLVTASFGVIAAVVVSVAYRWLRPLIGRLEPRQRFRVLLLLCALPLVVGLGVAVATLLPSLGGLFWPGLDHCPSHHSGHDHLCVVHTPGPLGLEAWLLLAGVAVVLGALAAPRGQALLRAGRRAKRFVARGRAGDRGLTVVDSDAPFALTVGVVTPRVVVSRGLLETLSGEELEAVLAHERAHARRRDSLWKIVASLLGVCLLPGTRRQLLADLELAAEQVCDEEAAERVGDRLKVAQAILTLERRLTELPAPHRAVTTAFDDAPAVRRVELLLAESERPTLIRLDITFVLITAVALLSASTLHHAAETLLGSLLGR